MHGHINPSRAEKGKMLMRLKLGLGNTTKRRGEGIGDYLKRVKQGQQKERTKHWSEVRWGRTGQTRRAGRVLGADAHGVGELGKT